VCLCDGELSLGPRDVLLGEVDGVPVYRMPSRPGGLEPDRRYVLDLRNAMPVGFSLSPGDGQAFCLREVLSASLPWPVPASQTYGLTDLCSPELGNAPGEVPVTAVGGEGITGYHRVGRLVGQQNVGRVAQLLGDAAG
jgi:hypothetical protein